MGRKTYDSLPDKYKPLPNRTNVVVTRDTKLIIESPQVEIIHSAENYINTAKNNYHDQKIQELWILGGAEIYRATMPYWDELYLTLVHTRHVGDTFFPEFEDKFQLVEQERFTNYSFLRYVRS